MYIKKTECHAIHHIENFCLVFISHTTQQFLIIFSFKHPIYYNPTENITFSFISLESIISSWFDSKNLTLHIYFPINT